MDWPKTPLMQNSGMSEEELAKAMEGLGMEEGVVKGTSSPSCRVSCRTYCPGRCCTHH